jgi:hypothetical protein
MWNMETDEPFHDVPLNISEVRPHYTAPCRCAHPAFRPRRSHTHHCVIHPRSRCPIRPTGPRL